MPFVCKSCKARCLYVAQLVDGIHQLCRDCAQPRYDSAPFDYAHGSLIKGHAKSLQDQLFPTSVRRPRLPEICLLVRDSIRGDADHQWPTDQLEEVKMMLDVRLEHWDIPQQQCLESQMIDTATYTMVQATIDLIDRELEFRKTIRPEPMKPKPAA